jgi:hypothetical protein
MGPMDRKDRAAALLLGAFVFSVYAFGACRTIYVGDSGELVTAVALLGIPHPTGYPLYVLLGKLWTLLLPFGSIAWRMSLFSAACGAAASALLFLLLRRAGRTFAIAAVFAALLLAFGPSFWGEANVQRAHTLNGLFVVLATWAAWRWFEERSGRRIALVAFVCGLGATNHTFLGVYALAFGVFALSVEPSLLRRPRQLAAAAAATLAGLLPYAYLPLRSRANPRLDWGDPETLGRFLDVVLRRDFWGRAWLEGPADLLPIVPFPPADRRFSREFELLPLLHPRSRGRPGSGHGCQRSDPSRGRRRREPDDRLRPAGGRRGHPRRQRILGSGRPGDGPHVHLDQPLARGSPRG